MKRLEAFCDAIASYNHYWDMPEGDAYTIRNPLMLSGDPKNPSTPDGKRVFSCHRAGYAAGLDRVRKYCAEHPTSSVQALLERFGVKMHLQQEHAIDFISRCANSTVSMQMEIRWFIEEEHG